MPKWHNFCCKIFGLHAEVAQLLLQNLGKEGRRLLPGVLVPFMPMGDWLNYARLVAPQEDLVQ